MDVARELSSLSKNNHTKQRRKIGRERHRSIFACDEITGALRFLFDGERFFFKQMGNDCRTDKNTRNLHISRGHLGSACLSLVASRLARQYGLGENAKDNRANTESVCKNDKRYIFISNCTYYVQT